MAHATHRSCTVDAFNHRLDDDDRKIAYLGRERILCNLDKHLQLLGDREAIGQTAKVRKARAHLS